MRDLPAILLASAVAVIGATPAEAADIAVIRREVAVAAPAGKTWQRIGGYCAIAEWLKVSCAMPSGDGSLGSVRILNDATAEVLVAKTPLSYTYHQTVGNMAAYGYHGTLAVEPVGRRAARLIYTLVYDAATMSVEKKAAERTRLETRFQGALETMKALAEQK